MPDRSKNIKPRRPCPKCGSMQTTYNGTSDTGQQKFYCKSCRKYGLFDLVRNIEVKEDEDIPFNSDIR